MSQFSDKKILNVRGARGSCRVNTNFNRRMKPAVGAIRDSLKRNANSIGELAFLVRGKVLISGFVRKYTGVHGEIAREREKRRGADVSLITLVTLCDVSPLFLRRRHEIPGKRRPCRCQRRRRTRHYASTSNRPSCRSLSLLSLSSSSLRFSLSLSLYFCVVHLSVCLFDRSRFSLYRVRR